MATEQESQLANSVLMIRPVRFQSNPHTSASNRFQGRTRASAEEQQRSAAGEFASLAQTLRENGIEVYAFDDTPEPHTPDAIFPNNWVSFHADGTVVLYPMLAVNRRPERRPDIVDALATQHGFQVRRVIDLSHHEQNGHFLEGTGSMVLDRAQHVAYACLSPRTHLDVLGDFAQRLDYEVMAFDATDRDGVAIYHTNVLMNIGESLAVICADAIPRAEQRDAVLRRLADTGHEVVLLSMEQMEAFAGNMLELRDAGGERLIAMSDQARRSLDARQLESIGRHATIVSAAIDEIERSAGGSVRCMLAEIHLPGGAAGSGSRHARG